MPANHAAIYMPAQSRRATVNNGFGGFVLLGAQAVVAPVLCQMAAQHIGYFKKRPVHPSAHFLPINQAPFGLRHLNAGTGRWLLIGCVPEIF